MGNSSPFIDNYINPRRVFYFKVIMVREKWKSELFYRYRGHRRIREGHRKEVSEGISGRQAGLPDSDDARTNETEHWPLHKTEYFEQDLRF